MKRMTATLIVNALILLGVFSLVGVMFWVTKSLWALLGLVSLGALKNHHITPTACPKCHHKIKQQDED